MKQKTTREIEEIVKEIYGDKYVLMNMSEIRCRDTNEMLWDTLRFIVKYSKEEVVISYIQFEDIGYTTNEYNEHGDTPTNFTNWDLLDERLGVIE